MRSFFLPMNLETKKILLDKLLELITPERVDRFYEIINHRTNHIRVVVEDIFQPQNASAVIRSCDCFGIQNLHIIENKNKYKLNPDVALGSSKWVNLHKHNSTDTNNTKSCIDELKSSGYKIIATTPHGKTTSLEDFDVTQKFALFFGTEKEGLSEEVIEKADVRLKVPLYGFTESLNISVCAAVCLQYLTSKARPKVKSYYLTEEEKINTLINWAKQTIKNSDVIEQRILNELKSI